MKTYRDLEILSSSNSDKNLISQLIVFSKEHSDWDFLKKRTDDYSKDIDKPACIIALNSKSPKDKFGFGFASREPNKGIYLTAITPKNSAIGLKEYNNLVSNFAKAFKNFVSRKKFKCRLNIGKENLELKDIITAPKTRSLFEFYLNQFPRSRHSLDVKRLDNFICALHRFNAHVNLEELENHLIKDLNWSQEDADWCTQRISTGLHVLKANQKFY